MDSAPGRETAQSAGEADWREITEDLPVGGQAVIEGVMMRVAGRIVTAVRRADGTIAVRQQNYTPVVRRFPVLDVPVLRGAISFVEMLIIGLGALSYSADVAMEEESRARDANPARPDRPSWRDRLMLAGSLVGALGAGIALFFFFPLLVATALHVDRGAASFNLAAGLVRTFLLLGYLWAIGRWGEIQRVFQYHGAEHKAIFALEACGAEKRLTVARARLQSRFHPRCGTSFMLIVVLLAVAVFSCADALFPVIFRHPQTLLERFTTHVSLLPLLGGVGFELLKLSGRKRNHSWVRFLSAPGLWLQRITTREPDDSQLEVGVIALRCALGGAEPEGEGKVQQQEAAARSS